MNSASQWLSFVKHLQTRSRALPRPNYKYLEVWNIGTCVKDAPQIWLQDAINPKILESFLKIFSNTITALHLLFIAPPTQTMKAIERVKNLNILQLTQYHFTCSDSEATAEQSARFQ
jgi:hypothetical protein